MSLPPPGVPFDELEKLATRRAETAGRPSWLVRLWRRLRPTPSPADLTGWDAIQEMHVSNFSALREVNKAFAKLAPTAAEAGKSLAQLGQAMTSTGALKASPPPLYDQYGQPFAGTLGISGAGFLFDDGVQVKADESLAVSSGEATPALPAPDLPKRALSLRDL